MQQNWYTDGRQFVIVAVSMGGMLYDEYAIDLSEVENILDSEFLEKLE